MSREQKRIEWLMHQYIKDIDNDKRIKIFNELKTYGNKGIEAISELIKITGSDDLIVYGLGIIKNSNEYNFSKDI